MKNRIKISGKSALFKMASLSAPAVGATLLLIILNSGCQKSNLSAPASSDESSAEWKLSDMNSFTQTNLVSDVDEYDPLHIDQHLVNAWGLAFNDEGEAWVSAAEVGFSTVYDANGQTLMNPVTIPFGG